MYVSESVSCSAHRDQKMVSDPLELELQRVVSWLIWAMRTGPGSSTRAVSCLYHWAITPALTEFGGTWGGLHMSVIEHVGMPMDAGRGSHIPWSWSYRHVVNCLMWLLGTKLRSSEKAGNALDHWAFLSSTSTHFFHLTLFFLYFQLFCLLHLVHSFTIYI